MSPHITEVVVESKKTLALDTGDYVSELRSLRIAFEKGELPLAGMPEEVNLPAYLTGLGRMTESQVAEALEPYLGDGDFKTREHAHEKGKPEPMTKNQEKAVYGKAGALKKLGEGDLADAIIKAHLEDERVHQVDELSKAAASRLLDKLDKEIKDRKDGGQE